MTTSLSSQITGNDYFSAHHSRMEVNNQYFTDMAKELTTAGFDVYTQKDGLTSFIHVEDSQNQITFGFAEVPYRWYISCNINYKLGHGTSRTIKERFDYNRPFTIQEIIDNMQPIVPVISKPSSYLKLFTI